MLIARDLRIDVGPRTLLEGASFSVQSGDRIGLVGRNGAGKTTLMRTLTGDAHSRSEGTVLRSGRIRLLLPGGSPARTGASRRHGAGADPHGQGDRGPAASDRGGQTSAP